MILNQIGIVQSGNVYHFYTETNLYLGCLALPPNEQYAFDTKVLETITKALAIRWGIIEAPRKK